MVPKPDLAKPGLLKLAAAFALLAVGVGVGLWLLVGRDREGVALAGSGSEQDRLEAVEKLRGSASEAASKALAKLARDKADRVALRAVRALGDTGYDRNRQVLTDLLTDTDADPRVRGEAAATVGKFEKVDPAVLTRALADANSPEVRVGAARGLVRVAARQKTVAGAKGLIPQLSAALEDPDSRVRAWAITGIHKLILRRFPFSPKSPPETQRAKIEAIRNYLRQQGVL